MRLESSNSLSVRVNVWFGTTYVFSVPFPYEDMSGAATAPVRSTEENTDYPTKGLELQNSLSVLVKSWFLWQEIRYRFKGHDPTASFFPIKIREDCAVVPVHSIEENPGYLTVGLEYSNSLSVRVNCWFVWKGMWNSMGMMLFLSLTRYVMICSRDSGCAFDREKHGLSNYPLKMAKFVVGSRHSSFVWNSKRLILWAWPIRFSFFPY